MLDSKDGSKLRMEAQARVLSGAREANYKANSLKVNYYYKAALEGLSKLAVREVGTGLLDGVLGLAILPEVDHLGQAVQQHHIVPVRQNK